MEASEAIIETPAGGGKSKAIKIRSIQKRNPMSVVVTVSVVLCLLFMFIGILAQVSPDIVDLEGKADVIKDGDGDIVAGIDFTGKVLNYNDKDYWEPVTISTSVSKKDIDEGIVEDEVVQKLIAGEYYIATLSKESGYFVGDFTKNSAHLDGDAINFFLLAILPLFGPVGIYYTIRERRIRQIESRLPDFLRDVAEAGRFGLTLADSIIIASSGNYGRLTPEIKKMAAQIQWNVPVSEALRLLSERVDTPLVNKVCAIVIKSNEAGGDVADVLTLVSHDAKETQLMQKERSLSMSTYLAVIYISFVVFLVTILILNATFLPQMEEAGRSTQEIIESGGAALEGATTIQSQAIPVIQFIYLIAAVAHGIGDGIIAGALDTGQVLNGFKHSFIMVIITFMMLRLM